jgi:Na+-transporting NADH:ubiquinone oxidoreductase subunit NqrC
MHIKNFIVLIFILCFGCTTPSASVSTLYIMDHIKKQNEKIDKLYDVLSTTNISRKTTVFYFNNITEDGVKSLLLNSERIYEFDL